MKVFALAVFLLTITSVSGHAQRIYFSDTTNRWYIHLSYSSSGQTSFSYSCDWYDFYLPQMVQNGVVYQPLVIRSQCFDFPSPGLNPVTSGDSALIREDTMAKKVYARVYKYAGSNTNDTSEVLLYDYNLQIGDTFRITNPFGSFVNYVSDIDTIFINGIVHRRWTLDPETNGPDWSVPYDVTEGVGASFDPLFSYKPHLFLNDGGWQLICFKNQFLSTSSPDNLWTNCTLGINNIVSSKELQVYPNPAFDFVSVSTALSSFPINTTVCIYNAIGNIVVNQQVDNSVNKITLDIRNLANGLYYISVSDKAGYRYNQPVLIDR